MIKLMSDDSEALKAFEFDPVLGSRIYTLYRCYKNDYSFLKLWTAYDNNNNITACISIMSGVVTVAANEKCDFEELAEFFGSDETIDSFEISELYSEKLNKFLSLPEKELPVMLYNSETKYEGSKNDIYTDVLHFAYEILRESDSTLEKTDFISWFYDTHKRRKEKLCEVFAVKTGEEWSCTAGYYIASPAGFVIGGVATKPQYRNKGLASDLTAYIADFLNKHGKKVYLVAAEEKLIKFYERIGFSEVYRIKRLLKEKI